MSRASARSDWAAARADLPIITGFRHAVAGLMSRYDETTVPRRSSTAPRRCSSRSRRPPSPIRLLTWVGRRTPAYASASGRVILAGRPPDAIAAEYGGGP